MSFLRPWLAAALALSVVRSNAQPFDTTTAHFQRSSMPFMSRQEQNATSADGSANTTCATSNGNDPSTFSPPLYEEGLRPQIHFSPSSGFMNDPNGLVRSGDTWHMYYQYNPTENVAGNQHWGHATSKDLYHWQNHLPSIAPESESEGIFSGSAVLDVNNTSGFFADDVPAENRFVAIYTLNTPTSQDQRIAYSTDGQNYTKFEGNPVLTLNTTQFRDPKVFWDDSTSQWVMAVALPQDYQVGFYGSKDLRSWTELSKFGPAGLLGFQYECPDLVQIPIEGGERDGQKAWVLILSINPGAPMGGSFVETFIGDWDGTKFTTFDQSIQIPDFGKEFYASQTFYNAPDGKAIAMTWASNWQYTNIVPTSPWRSVMTIPRELTVRWIDMNPMHKGYQVTMKPYNLDVLPRQTLQDGPSTETIALNGEGAFEINATVVFKAGQEGFPKIEFTVATPNDGEWLKVGVQFSEVGLIYVDRRRAGRAFGDNEPLFNDRFSQQFYTTKRGDDQVVDLQIVVDRSITEIFTQDGVAAGSVLHYWDNEARPSSLSIVAASEAVQLESLQVQALDSTWPSCSS